MGASRGSQSSLSLFQTHLIFSVCFSCLHGSPRSSSLSSLPGALLPTDVGSALLYGPILLLLGIMVHVGHWSKEQRFVPRIKAQAQQLLLPTTGTDPFPPPCFCPFPALRGSGHRGPRPPRLHLRPWDFGRVGGSVWGGAFRVGLVKSHKLPPRARVEWRKGEGRRLGDEGWGVEMET